MPDEKNKDRIYNQNGSWHKDVENSQSKTKSLTLFLELRVMVQFQRSVYITYICSWCRFIGIWGRWDRETPECKQCPGCEEHREYQC